MAWLLVTGCSPGGWFGDGKDEDVSREPSLHQPLAECARLDLSTELRARSLREVVRCLNGNHELDPVQALLDDVSDTQLEPSVAALNRIVLDQPKRLFELETSWNALQERGLLDPLLQSLGEVAQDPELVRDTLLLIGRLREQRPELAAEALSKLGSGLDEGTRLLEIGLNLVESRAYRSLSRNLQQTGSSVSLEALVEKHWLGFISDSEQDPDHFPVVEKLWQELRDGRVYRLLDGIAGASSAELRTKVPRTALALQGLATELPPRAGFEGSVLGGMSSLLHFAHRPIRCFGGTQSTRDGALLVLSELSRAEPGQAGEYIRRKRVLELASVASFCEMPPELGQLYPDHFRLVGTNAVEPLAASLRAFGDAGMLPWLAGFFADTGSGSLDDRAGFKRLIPWLEEGARRQIWEDLLLLSEMPRDEDRPGLTDTAAFWMKADPRLENRSLLDVLGLAFASAGPGEALQTVRSLSRLALSSRTGVFLAAARAASLINKAHPGFGALGDLLKEAGNRPELLDSLLRLAKSERFVPALAHLALLSRDRRLKPMVSDLLALYHGRAVTAAYSLPTEQPADWVPARRHDLAASDLERIALDVSHPVPLDDPCTQVDIGLRLIQDSTSPGYEQALNRYLACMDQSREGESGFSGAVRYLRSRSTSDGRSFYQLNLDIVQAFKVGAQVAAQLGRDFVSAVRAGEVDRASLGLAYWVKPNVPGADGAAIEPGLLILKAAFGRARTEVRQVFTAVAKGLRQEQVPAIARYLRELGESAAGSIEEPEAAPPALSEALESKLMASVANRECVAEESKQRARARALWDDFLSSATNFELVGQGSSLARRRDWALPEFRKTLSPLLSKLADPAQAMPDKSVVDAFGIFFRYFLPLGNQHFETDYLAQWLTERAQDERPILYFYMEDRAPKVQLVNSLDLLEILVLNGDFSFVKPENVLHQVLTSLANAWGDEKEETWPKAVYDEYLKTHKRPLTFRQAFSKIDADLKEAEDLFGYPSGVKNCRELPNADRDEIKIPGGPALPLPGPHHVKVRLFNIRQAVQVLEENLLDSGHAHAGGIRVLRNLFYEVLTSSPPEYRDPTIREKNNLSIITRFSQLGMLRQLGRKLRAIPAGDPALLDHFRAELAALSSDRTVDLLENVLGKDPKHKLLNAFLVEVFKTIDQKGSQGMRKLAYYSMASAHALGLTSQLVETLRGAILGHEAFLSQNLDALDDLLSSKKPGRMIELLWQGPSELPGRKALTDFLPHLLDDGKLATSVSTLVQTVAEAPESRGAWTEFRHRADALASWPPYRDLHLEELGKRGLRMVLGDPAVPTDPAVSAELRSYLAARLDGDLELWLSLAEQDPDGLNRLLARLGADIEAGGLREFTEMISRSLPEQ